MKRVFIFTFLFTAAVTTTVFDALSLHAARYLENIASVNYYKAVNNQHWWNQVWEAVDAGNVDVVRELCLDQPGDRMFCLATYSNEEDMTVLCHAAYCGHIEIVICLIKEFGVPIERPGFSSPLHLAIIGGQNRIVRYLLDVGALLDEKDEKERTPLHLAAVSGYPDILCMLLRAGADTDQQDNQGNTPARCAAAQSHYASLFYLLWKGGVGDEELSTIKQLIPEYACMTQRRHKRFVAQLSRLHEVTRFPPELDDLVAQFVYHVC